RTHQIRVHLLALDSPLLGDKLHGGPAFLTAPSGARQDFARPMLHALSLELRHPGGFALRIEAPLPADFEAARAFLRACSAAADRKAARRLVEQRAVGQHTEAQQ